MKFNIIAQCDKCSKDFKSSYYKVGLTIACPFCASNLKVKVKRYDGNTGIEITFDNFIQLLIYEPYRVVIIPIIEQWFSVKVSKVGDKVLIRDKSGQSIELDELHEIIQTNQDYQSRIYNEAMTLWR